MLHSSKGSEQPQYFKSLFDLLEITPEFNIEALQALQQKEIELGIKIPNALKECFCYFDKQLTTNDPSIFYSYDDHHPNSPSIIRRMQALYGMHWDLYHYDEEGERSILNFWSDSAGSCSFHLALDGSENPAIYDYGMEYTEDDEILRLIKVSNHFSDFIILMFFNLVNFRHRIISSTNEPLTQTQLVSLIQLFPNYIKRDLANFENFKDSSGFHNPSHHFLIYSDSQVIFLEKGKNGDGFAYKWKLNAKNEDLLKDLADKVIDICPNLASCLK